MSLRAWACEDEDKVSLGPVPTGGSAYHCDARAQESDSDGQCSRSSSGSSEVLAGTANADVPQVVPCKFTISLAFPGNISHKGKYTSLIKKHRKHPKMNKPLVNIRRFYHIEYFLLPDDGEAKKVDMLVLPAVVKVFLDSGIKTVRPWHEGDKMWVSWTQTFSINMTKELLKRINFHKITLRLWDTKDKVSRKVRYYRLKMAGYAEAVGPFEEVKHLVLHQRRWWEQGSHLSEEQDQEDVPGKPEKAGKCLKSLRDLETSSGLHVSKQSSLVCVFTLTHLLRQSFAEHSPPHRPSARGWHDSVCEGLLVSVDRPGIGQLETFAHAYHQVLRQQRPKLFPRTRMNRKSYSEQKVVAQLVKWKESGGKRSLWRGRRSRAEEADPQLASTWKQGSFSLQLSIMPLLAGRQAVISRGSGRSANILDCFLTLKTQVPIMTEEQKQDLNPLTIKIKCASCLPTQPVPIHELERLCAPVYCCYRFHETPVHQTEGKPHGSHISFQDINVIFLGALHPADLREYLEGPPMVVEVHDRDRRSEDHSWKPTLFGEDPLDSHLNFQALISPEDTENNPFEFQNKMWDPYGVAQVSFTDLLHGHKYLNLAVPIHSCAPKATQHGQNSGSRKAVGHQAHADGLHHVPVPIGHYLEASSMLKLRVDIAVPLLPWAEAPQLGLTATPFGRIIFVLDSRRTSLLHSLLQDIATINAKALGLGPHPAEDVQQMLSAFRMHVKIQDRQALDVLTGFHLLDGTLHLLVLEGVAEQGLQWLWHGYQHRMANLEPGKCKVLYNSQLLFRQRLYADLDTLLHRVHLFRPLPQLLQPTGLYIHSTVPWEVSQALSRIYSICHHSNKLRDVVAGGLLPSSATIRDLSREFGLPLSQELLKDGKHVAEPTPPTPAPWAFQGRDPTLTCETLTLTEKHPQRRDTVAMSSRATQENVRAAALSSPPPGAAGKVHRIAAAPGGAVHNYSIQTLNSAELAKQELRREMAQEPCRRFTYSQNYLSATLEPQDLEQEEKNARKRCHQAWRTACGFQVVGLGSSDRPLPLLPSGTSTELTEEWKENALFANVLRPVLDRGPWGWDLRHRDFHLYQKPPPFLELPACPAPRPRTVTAAHT